MNGLNRAVMGLSMSVALLSAGTAHAQKAPKSVIVHMETAAGQDGGQALLIQKGSGVEFKVHFINLDPGQHAIHVHQYPHCDAPDFKTAGGHFNPTGKEHGRENPKGHHAGDLPKNLTVDDSGSAETSFFSKDLTLNPSKPNSVFANGGTSIIVHGQPDDMKTNPSGNAGIRESCGIISKSNASNKVQNLDVKKITSLTGPM